VRPLDFRYFEPVLALASAEAGVKNPRQRTWFAGSVDYNAGLPLGNAGAGRQ